VHQCILDKVAFDGGHGQVFFNDVEVVTWSDLYPPPSFGEFEGLDVDTGRRGPVLWELCERREAFAYTSEVDSVFVVPGKRASDTAEQKGLIHNNRKRERPSRWLMVRRLLSGENQKINGQMSVARSRTRSNVRTPAG
jgi:hypothetical protein